MGHTDKKISSFDHHTGIPEMKIVIHDSILSTHKLPTERQGVCEFNVSTSKAPHYTSTNEELCLFDFFRPKIMKNNA